MSEKQQKRLSVVQITQFKYRKLLFPFSQTVALNVRKIIGKKNSLKNFLSRIGKYAEEKVLLVELSAVKEKGKELQNCLSNIQMRRDDLKIIIFAPENKIGDHELQELAVLGFTNIVADTTYDSQKDRWQEMLNDLSECLLKRGGLSRDKWQVYLQRNVQAAEPNEVQTQYEHCVSDYSGRNFKLDFYGTTRRVGTTSTALLTAQYFAKGGSIVEFFFQTEKEYNFFTKYYRAQLKFDGVKKYCADTGVVYTFENSGIGTFANCEVFIRDRGPISNKIQADPDKIIVLVSNNDYYDTMDTLKGKRILNNLNTPYINLVNFSEAPIVSDDSMLEDMQSGAYAVPFSPNKMIFPQSGIDEFNKAFSFLSQNIFDEGDEADIYESVSRQYADEEEFEEEAILYTEQ